LLRTGINQWDPAPGSQGIINPPAVEEAIHQFGNLTALSWIPPNLGTPEKLGFNTNNLSIAIDLKTGEKLSVDFGSELPQLQTALAGVTLDGRRWGFILPPTLYQLVVAYLTIPPVPAQ